MARRVGLVLDPTPKAPKATTDLTKAELKDLLDTAGIEYDDRMTKDELLALLRL